MKRGFRRAFATTLVVVILLCAVDAHGNCPLDAPNQGTSQWFDDRWLVTYDGDINGVLRIRMTLLFRGDRLQGHYFYATSLQNISVEGEILRDRRLFLYERDAKGVISARFAGEFVLKDPRQHYGPSAVLACEVMVGNWIEDKSGRVLPFYLQLQFAQMGTLGDRYANWSGTRTDEPSVEKVAKDFVRAFRDDDRAAVATMIHYPVTIHLNENRRKLVSSSADFLSLYEAAFPDYLRNEILNAMPMHMPLGKYELVRIGRTNGPWIGPDMKVWLYGAADP